MIPFLSQLSCVVLIALSSRIDSVLTDEIVEHLVPASRKRRSSLSYLFFDETSSQMANEPSYTTSRPNLLRRSASTLNPLSDADSIVPNEEKILLIPSSGATFVTKNYPYKNNKNDVIEVDISVNYKVGLLKFDLPCVKGNITGAVLRMDVQDPSPRGGEISLAESNWEQDTVTWWLAPEIIGDPLLSIGRVKKNATLTIDLFGPMESYFSDNPDVNQISFRIDPEDEDGADYNNAQLEVAYNSNDIRACQDEDSQLLDTIPVVDSSQSTINLTTNSTYIVSEEQVLLFPSSGATFVSRNYPYKNFKNRLIEVDISSNYKVGLLKFDLSCVSGRITGIVLKLDVEDPSPRGGEISLAESNWEQDTVTWYLAPEKIGDPLLSIGKVIKNTEVVLDLYGPMESYFLDNLDVNQVSFRIDPEDKDGADYKNANLEVTFEGKDITGCQDEGIQLQDTNSVVDSTLQSAEIQQNVIVERDSSEYFQIRMYWEYGHYWQEEHAETRWCVEYRDSGQADQTGSIVELEMCHDGNTRQRWFFRDNMMESYRSPGYCISWSGSDVENQRKIFMESCSVAKPFTGFRSDGVRFEWHPYNIYHLCVTNQHHPRGNEHLYFSECETARYDKTSYWYVGLFHRHSPDSIFSA